MPPAVSSARARTPALRVAAGRALVGALSTLGFAVAAAEAAAGCGSWIRRCRRRWRRLARSTRSTPPQPRRPSDWWPPAPRAWARRFKIKRVLGAGATSHVYQAEDTLLGQEVALKLLSVGTHYRPRRARRLRALRPRGGGGRTAAPPQHRGPLRRRRGGRPVRVGAAAGRVARRAPERARAAVAWGGAAAGAGSALGAGRRARTRDRPPRRQDREHSVRRRGQREAGRLRRGPPGRLRSDPDRRLARDPGVHVARTDQRRHPHPGRGSLRARRHAVRGADRATTVPRPRHRRPAPRRGTAPPVGRGARPRAVRTTLCWPGRSRRPPATAGSRRGRWPRRSPAGRRAAARSRRRQSRRRMAADRPPDESEQRPRRAELGSTTEGRLVRRHDPRLGRPVLIEHRRVPVEGRALERLRALAALGGPHVQRILALSEDARTVTYEDLPGPRQPLASLAPELAARLTPLADAIAAALDDDPASGSRRAVVVDPRRPGDRDRPGRRGEQCDPEGRASTVIAGRSRDAHEPPVVAIRPHAAHARTAPARGKPGDGLIRASEPSARTSPPEAIERRAEPSPSRRDAGDMLE